MQQCGPSSSNFTFNWTGGNQKGSENLDSALNNKLGERKKAHEKKLLGWDSGGDVRSGMETKRKNE